MPICSFPIEINSWDQISKRYASRLPNVGKIRSEVLDDTELTWLENMLADDITKFAGSQKKYQLRTALLFYSEPGAQRSIHVDFFSGWKHHPTWALNVPILNCDQSEMLWYTGEYTKEERTNPGGNAYYHLSYSKPLTLVESAIIDKPTLVYVDMPHDVVNHSSLPRILLSLRYSPVLLNFTPPY